MTDNRIRDLFLSSSALALLVAAAFAPSAIRAQTWDNASGGDWNDATNWTPQSVPNGQDATAVIGPGLSSNVGLFLRAPVTIGQLALSGSNKYSIIADPTQQQLTFDVSTGSASIDQTGASQMSIAADTVLSDDLDINLDQGSRLKFTFEVEGPGALNVNGAGTVILSAGFNSYTGGTTINGGTLIVQPDTLPGDVTNNATLRFLAARDATYSGLISGGGEVVKFGSGQMTFTANHTYTGTTRIDAGTLMVGDGKGQGAIVGDVENTGILAFNRNDQLTYGGEISGIGSVEQRGTGSVILTGDSTFSGDLVMKRGFVQIGDGGTSGSVTADILNNGATVIFARSDEVTYAGTISGTGSLSKSAGGTLALTGDNTYTGLTVIGSGSTLQLGNGGTTGSIQSDVLNAGTLAFNRSNRLTFDGVVSGAGDLVVKSGTVRLTADNTYTGGTTIRTGGNLIVGDGATSGSITGDVVDNGVLNFARSDDLTFAGVISGTGIVAHAGTGTLTLTGDSTHTGGTFVSKGGSLQIGNGGTTGSISGDIGLVNGTLAFNRSDRLTFGGVISGAGNVALKSGSVRLTGDNTYAGGTTIRSGSNLIVGDGGTNGSINGNVTNNGVLNFARSDRVTFGGEIGGSGIVAHAGTGTLRLTGDSTYTGSTFVSNGGTLMVEGSLASDIDVRTSSGGKGSRIGGSGITSGALTVEAGSTAAPGSSGIGALTVGGFNLLAGGVLEVDAVEASAGGLSADRLNVAGTATFGETSVGAGKPYGPTVIDVKFEADAKIPALEGITIVAADGGLKGVAPTVLLDPASLPNGYNFRLDLEATNLGGTFAKPGEAIPDGAGGAGFVVLQVANADPTYVTPPQTTVINAPYLVPSGPNVLAPGHVPQLVPTATPTAIPVLAPALIKGPTANVTTPVVIGNGGTPAGTGIQVSNHGVQLGGSTLTPQPQTATGTPTNPDTIPVGTVTDVVVVEPPAELVIDTTVYIPVDPNNTDVVIVEPPTDKATTSFVSVSGTYGKVDQTHAPTGTKFAVLYKPHSVQVVNIPKNYGNLKPLGVKQTGTQRAIGRAVNTLLPKPHERPTTKAQSRLVAGLYPLTLGQIDDALDSIAGEDEDPTFVTVLNTREFQNSMSNRLRERRDGSTGLSDGVTQDATAASGDGKAWGELLGGYADGDYLDGSKIRSWGLVLGADTLVSSDLVAGVALSYTDASLDLDSGSNDDASTLEAAVYGSWTSGDWFVNGNIGFSYNWLEIDRAIRIGSYGDTVSGETNATSFFTGIETGKAIRTSWGVLEPTFGLRYQYVDRDGYTEDGPETLARKVSGEILHTGQGILGVRAYGSYSGAGDVMWRPEIRAAYARELGDSDIDGSASLVGAPGSSFDVFTAGPGEDVGILGLRLDGKGERVDYYVDYQAEAREGLFGSQFRIGFNMAF